jgi:hypothetical protein
MTSSRCTTYAHSLRHHVSKPSCHLHCLPTCTTSESPSEAEQPAAICCKPILPNVSLLRAPSSDVVLHHTGNCQATPATTVCYKHPESTPMQRPLAAGITLATTTRDQKPPSSQPPAPTALPRHPWKPPLTNGNTGNATR